MKRKWFRRNWLKLVEYLFGIPLVGFILLGIVNLVKDENWLAISAIASLVLAGAAFISVRQVNVNQKREKGERLLNEIIEWAEDVAKCGSTVNIQSPQPFYSALVEKDFFKLRREEKERLLKGLKKDDERIWRSCHMELIFKYQVVDARGEYILEISNLQYFNISAKVNEVKDNLKKTLEIYWNYLKDITDTSIMDKVIEWEHKLQENAVSLIKETTKIKTKDIS